MEYRVKERWHIEASKQMKAITDSLEIIEDRDTVSLDLLGDALDTYHRANDGLITTGLVVENKQGNLVSSPYVKIKNDAQITAFKIMKQFGLNPLDRKKLVIEDKEEESELTRFLKSEVEVR